MRLYTYFRSSAAYRVRIALGLKQLDWQAVPVHLVQDGGQHHSEAYKAINPAGLVPAFEDNGAVLTQSLAIIEYLDETYPTVSLLPGDAVARAHIRALAQSIACDLHPINNLRILKHLEHSLGLDAEQRKVWYLHWIQVGLEAFEQQLAVHNQPGDFCYGNSPTLADICLVPQVYNANRFGYSVDHLPRIAKAIQACAQLPAFIQAEPANQIDAD
ncbi:maleylacetoacetate isomerase [uncultured Paenalcaligenes sp.]|uniref:maleylacetoacetate isomerase n=1 Tax=uncultured Paenalcaligenes sp. TaxID=1588925 RepID=UPI00261600D1|nr:maleylacetoacetate isomerase [uncultured Paenalcaligenes sp.]